MKKTYKQFRRAKKQKTRKGKGKIIRYGGGGAVSTGASDAARAAASAAASAAKEVAVDFTTTLINSLPLNYIAISDSIDEHAIDKNHVIIMFENGKIIGIANLNKIENQKYKDFSHMTEFEKDKIIKRNEELQKANIQAINSNTNATLNTKYLDFTKVIKELDKIVESLCDKKIPENIITKTINAYFYNLNERIIIVGERDKTKRHENTNVEFMYNTYINHSKVFKNQKCKENHFDSIGEIPDDFEEVAAEEKKANEKRHQNAVRNYKKGIPKGVYTTHSAPNKTKKNNNGDEYFSLNI